MNESQAEHLARAYESMRYRAYPIHTGGNIWIVRVYNDSSSKLDYTEFGIDTITLYKRDLDKDSETIYL